MRATLILVALTLAAACDHDPTAEARTLVERVNQLDLHAPPDERRRRVDSLASLPLRDEAIKATRDVCVDAHRSILDAEERHANAIGLYAVHGEAAPDDVRSDIERNLEESSRALERSRDLFSRCLSETGSLEGRYGRGRR